MSVGKAFSLEPMLCESVESPPEGRQWQYELKLDGFRALGRKFGRNKCQAFYICSGEDRTQYGGSRLDLVPFPRLELNEGPLIIAVLLKARRAPL
jgi:hypothetical protein